MSPGTKIRGLVELALLLGPLGGLGDPAADEELRHPRAEVERHLLGPDVEPGPVARDLLGEVAVDDEALGRARRPASAASMAGRSRIGSPSSSMIPIVPPAPYAVPAARDRGRRAPGARPTGAR